MASLESFLVRGLTAVALSSAVAAPAFAAPVPINGGGVGIGYLAYLNEFTDLFKINSTFIFGNRAVTPQVTYFGSVGSTKAINAFLNNDYTQLNGGTVAPIASFGPETVVHYGTTEVLLTSAQVTAYNSSAVGQAGGPLIQVPAEGIAVAILFTDNGARTLKLNDNDLCGVFSGKLTNWNQTSAAGTVAANPITVVYRNDGAGSTSLLTRHLGAVCTTGPSGNSNVAFTATDFFATNFATLPANFFGVKGTTGMQNQILVTPSGIGYLSPDFTSLTPKSGNYNPNVFAASLVNQFTGVAYLPTLSAITSALATSVAPPSTKAAASDPTAWIPIVPSPRTGYPVVGFSNVLASQCYKNATVTNGMKTFLQNQYNNNSAFLQDMNNAGIVQVPNLLSATYVTAINKTFLNNTSGYNLNIGNPAVCKNGGSAGRYPGR